MGSTTRVWFRPLAISCCLAGSTASSFSRGAVGGRACQGPLPQAEVQRGHQGQHLIGLELNRPHLEGVKHRVAAAVSHDGHPHLLQEGQVAVDRPARHPEAPGQVIGPRPAAPHQQRQQLEAALQGACGSGGHGASLHP